MKKSHHTFDLRGMTVFLQVARDLSFTAAAEKLCMTPSAASKALSRLEDSLGVTLLNRDPRSVSLTAEGKRFYGEAEQIVAAIDRARNTLAEPSPAVRGLLRVCVPFNFGRTFVTPKLAAFSRRHPALNVELLLINGRYDPIELGIDLALHAGGTSWIDPRLTVRQSATMAFVLCAAPAYLLARGTPKKISDLDGHDALGGIDEKTGHITPWRFLTGVKEVSYQPRARVVSNAVDVLVSMAIEGAGIVCLPGYLAAQAIRDGGLRLVLPGVGIAPAEYQLICPKSRSDSPAVDAFMEILAEPLVEMGRLPPR